jgi:anionic cell wall polymer biosynthesis LytR-Cps2A-Psr (LCP) family protein
MDAVPIVNDMIGGVTLTLEEDLTDLNPSYTEGSRITLKGDDALSFVRARMSVGDGLNLSRMARQRQYIAAFIDQFRTAVGKDDAFLVRVVEKLDKKLTLNLGMNQIRALSDKLRDYEILPPIVPKGENRQGEMFMEYYVDEESLWETVRELFCEK